MTLEGRHALVTGGGTGIGLAVAQALAARGAQVTITGRRTSVLQQAARDGLYPLTMDITDEHQVADGIKEAVAARGPIRICIPNAGIAEGRALHKTDTELWRRIMATNLDGAFWTIRESLSSMRHTDWGRVIAISSVAGLRGLKGAAAYTASKHGLIGLVRALSEDYLETALTFNAICPGYVDTEIVTRNVETIQARAGVSAEDARAMMVGANPHNRLIEPEEVTGGGALALRSGIAKREWTGRRDRGRAVLILRKTAEHGTGAQRKGKPMTDFTATKEMFHLPEGVVYLDGNSLGPLPRAAAGRLRKVMEDEWGEMLITAWNRAGWMAQPRGVGDRVGRLIGAEARIRGHGRHPVCQGLSGARLGACAAARPAGHPE